MGLILLAYLLLGTPVTVRASIGVSGACSTAQASIGALGVCAQIDALLRLDGAGLRLEPRYGPRRTRRRSPSSGRLWRRTLRTAMRASGLVRFSVRVRLGLGDAGATAMAAGAIRALASALLAARDEPLSGELTVVPDFTGPGFLLTARCIFSFTPGDIMIAAAQAAAEKTRKEGFAWISIPSRA